VIGAILPIPHWKPLYAYMRVYTPRTQVILEQRETPTSKTCVPAALAQNSGFDSFGDFAACPMWSRGAILIGVIYLVAG